jgi:cytochrome P450
MLLCMALPPEPAMSPLRQTLSWTIRPLGFLDRCRRDLGDSFSLTFLGFERPMVMISDPAAIKALYREPKHGLPPGRNIFLEPIVGSRSLLLLEGADHLAHRKLMLPAFHGERMRSLEPMVTAIVDAEIESWPLGREFPLHPHMQSVTLEVILRVVFGVSEGQRLDRLRDLLRNLLTETGSTGTQLRALLLRRFGGQSDVWGRFEDRLREVDELLYAEIAEHRRRDDLEERDDILSSLILARFEDGGSAERASEISGGGERERAKRDSEVGLSDTDLRDQLMTLLLAGHETTATGLAWSFDLILGHPEVHARLLETLEEGDESYLKASITESLRLRPVVPLAGRRLTSPLVTDDLELPEGTDVTPSIWLAHTRPDVYPEPHAFRPERFLEDGPETYSWIPFGGSVRRCIGGAFAEFEMRIVLREVLTRCELHKASPEPERVTRRNITFSPRNGTPVVLTARHPAPERELVAA